MEERHERGPELIAERRARVAELREEIGLLDSQGKLAKIVRLAREMNALQGDVRPEALAAMMDLEASSDDSDDEEGDDDQ